MEIWLLPSTCWAVKRLLGSGLSIPLTRSFALSETLGHGSLLKSMTDRIIAWATPCSVSALWNGSNKHTIQKEHSTGQEIYYSQPQANHPRGKIRKTKLQCRRWHMAPLCRQDIRTQSIFSILNVQCSWLMPPKQLTIFRYKTDLPRMEGHHKEGCKESLLHSKHQPLGHSFSLTPLEPCNKDFQQSQWNVHLHITNK